MQVQIHTDRNIQGHEPLARQVEAAVRETLNRFGERITRVEIHLTDENSDRKSGGADKRCLLEVRLAGRPPIAVSHLAPTVEQAVDGAAEKMERSLDGVLGRLDER